MLRSSLGLALRHTARHAQAVSGLRLASSASSVLRDSQPRAPLSAAASPSSVGSKRPANARARRAQRSPQKKSAPKTGPNSKLAGRSYKRGPRPRKRRYPEVSLEALTLGVADALGTLGENSGSISDVLGLYGSLDAGALAPHLPKDAAALAELVREQMDYSRLSEGQWIAMLRTVGCGSWWQARQHMGCFSDSDWPSFVLIRVLPLVRSADQASDALDLVRRRAATARPRRIGYVFVLIEKILRDVPALHLTRDLTDLIVQIAKEKRQEGKMQIDRLVTALAKHLRTHDDDRARTSALNLYEWAGSCDKELQQRLLAILSGVNRSSPPDLGGRSSTQVKRRHAKTKAGNSFFNVELAHRLLSDFDGHVSLRQLVLRKAILAAGAARDVGQCRHWFEELTEIAQDGPESANASKSARSHDRPSSTNLADMEVYVRAVANADRGGTASAWHAVNELQRALETGEEAPEPKINARTWHTILAYTSKEPRVSLDHVLAMLAIRLCRSTTPGHVNSATQSSISSEQALSAAMKLVAQFGGTERPYTTVMSGLVGRNMAREAVAVWYAMLHRAVRPTEATLTVLLQALFLLGEVRQAIEQMQVWCELGVPFPTVPSPIQRPLDLSAASLQESVADHLKVPVADSDSSDHRGETALCRLRPDTDMATVLFEGLYRHGADGTVMAFWRAMQDTLRVAPDAPILGILIKCGCGSGVLAPSRLAETDTDAFSPFISKNIFRRILSLQHPELEGCSIKPLLGDADNHGLLSGSNWLVKSEFGMKAVERWMGGHVSRYIGLFRTQQDIPIPFSSTPGEDGKDMQLDFTVNFAPELFDHYLRLLFYIDLNPPKGFFRLGGGSAGLDDGMSSGQGDGSLGGKLGRVEEMLLLLSWMRKLNVVPQRRTVASICLELEETLPPLSTSPRASAATDDEADQPHFTTNETLAGDAAAGDSQHADNIPLRENAGIIADWLYSWRGRRAWPTDREMRSAYKWKMERTRAIEAGGLDEWEQRRRWFTYMPSPDELALRRRQEEKAAAEDAEAARQSYWV